MHALLAVAWSWYGVAVLVTILRLGTRIHDLGSIKRLQPDDYLMTLALLFYTAQVLAVHFVVPVVDKLANTTDPFTASALGTAKAKYFMVINQCKIAAVFLVKACLIILNLRITAMLRVQRVAILVTSAYVVFGFVFIETFFYAVWCRPFSAYFDNPTGQCRAPINHIITEAVFNISSDVILLCITLPMLIRSGLRRQEKIFVCTLFGMGIFVVFCAAASKYYSFTDPLGMQWPSWFGREAATAIMVGNLPLMSSLMRGSMGYLKRQVVRRRCGGGVSAVVAPKRPYDDTDVDSKALDVNILTTIETSYCQTEVDFGDMCEEGGKDGEVVLQDVELIAPWLTNTSRLTST